VTTSIVARVDPARSNVEARADNGRLIVMDGEPPEGAGDLPGPKETLLAALAGCTAMDVGSILRKKRQVVESYEIAVSAESATEHPRVFTVIRVEHRVSGRVEPEPLRRSIELSATGYCPVNAMLSRAARIEHWYRLTDATGATTEALVAVTGPDGNSRVL
jgi:putative redox protein